MTRKLVDVAHDVIIRKDDCGYEGEGLVLKRDDDRRMDFVDRIFGRVPARDIKIGKKVVAKKMKQLQKRLLWK